MNIDISVVIWTIINFCILLVALNFVLFKPLLDFIHNRSERNQRMIDAGKNADIELERVKEEAEKQLETIRKDELKLSEKMLHDARVNRREAIAAAHSQADIKRAEGISELHKTESQAEAQLDAHISTLSQLIADKLTDSLCGNK